jgi:transposase
MIMLRPEPIGPVPAETVRLAQAAFPRGNLYLRLADELGTLFSDEQFADRFPSHGQPAFAPWRLALVTILQFAENLSDRQAADAVRGRIDWKYLLRRELGDAGFAASILVEFRARLVAGKAEARLLERLLDGCRERKLLKARGKQRTDSTHVLAAVRALNRPELVAETMYHALNSLAVAVPSWLRSVSPPAWLERYGQRAGKEWRSPSRAAQEVPTQTIGEDGSALRQAIFDPTAPPWVREIPAVDLLRRIWMQQYFIGEAGVRWRTDREGIPPSSRFLSSPDDPDAHFARKYTNQWIGYKIHVTATCETDLPPLITDVQTTAAPVADGAATPKIYATLPANSLLPALHLVDTGYLDAQLLVDSRKDYGVELLGPTRPDYHWQARANEGFAATDFTIDWDKQPATCPAKRTSISWTPAVDRGHHDVIKITFSFKDGSSCVFRPRCFHATRRSGRRALTVRPQDHFQALVAARERENTPEFAKLYAQRAGVEGTISRGIRTCGLRRTRYAGAARTPLGHVLTAVALDFLRLGEWFAEIARPKSRRSPFVRLMHEPLSA